VIPQTYREACDRPRGSLRTDGEVAGFVVDYELAMGRCDLKRRELVDLIDQSEKPPKTRSLLGFKLPF
jgi:hypothetical protein